jgi:hypothetical protein
MRDDGAAHGGTGPTVPHVKAAAARATASPGSFSLELLGSVDVHVAALVKTCPIARPPGMGPEVDAVKSLVTGMRCV